MKRVNIRDVAKEAGTSISSVSRCLNGLPGVFPPVRERILKAAERMGYRKKLDRISQIAIILPRMGSNAFLGKYGTAILNALQWEILSRRGYGSLILAAENVSVLKENVVSGAISFDFLKEIPYQLPNMKNIPLVCINDFSNPLEQVHSVCSNERQGIALAVGHFMENHHSRIGLLSQLEGQDVLGSINREQAFLDETARLGIAPFCHIQRFGASYRSLVETVLVLLRNKCTAILALGEHCEIETIHALQLVGKRIPEDVSLITFETIDSCFFQPRQTTIGQNFSVLAKEALDMLEKQIRGEEISGDVQVDYTLNIRESVRDLYQPI